jgi:RNA polymerase sigma factor (sigma-70 family)
MHASSYAESGNSIRGMVKLAYRLAGCIFSKAFLMDSKASVSQWFDCLKEGDGQAAQNLWERYGTRLLQLAKQKLNGRPKRLADEDDIAQCVFASLCRGAAAGRFGDIRNRDDLWWLLLAITQQKSVDLVRHEVAQKRGGGRVLSEATASSARRLGHGFLLDDLIGNEPTPEFFAMLEEQTQRLLHSLGDDAQRTVATRRIEGYTVEEIAAEMDVSTRSVERKLKLIRETWSQELERAERRRKSVS